MTEKNQRQIRNDFSKLIDAYQKYRRNYPDEAYKLIYDFCPNKEAKVIDIGCGIGITTNHLAQYYKEIIGVDKETKMISVAEKNRSENVSFVKAYAENLPFENNSFDLATIGAAYHWFDHDKAGKEIYRILKPSGKLCVFWKSGRGFRFYLPKFAFDNLKKFVPDIKSTNEQFSESVLSRVGFSNIRYEEFDFNDFYSKEEILGYIQSHSTFNLLDDKEKEEYIKLNAESVDNYLTDGQFIFESFMVMYFAEK